MSKNLSNLRFKIRREDGYTSSAWRLWVTTPGDVYLAIKSMAGIEKYSFHRSGICRSAFTKEYGTPSSMNDRVISKWKRLSTPPRGSGQASRVAWLAFPTDYLSRLNEQENKKTLTIPAAPSGGATFLEMAFTAETQNSVLCNLEIANRTLVLFTEISSEEAFLVFSYHGEWENSDLQSPPAEGSIFPDLLFSAHDPENTGRPVRIRISSNPKDGDAVLIRELGGYKV